MNKSGKQSLFKASLLAVLLATSMGVSAAGLGKLTVYSAIGQPLNAEVAITAAPEEFGALSAKLASHEAFRDAGIDFIPALTGLRFDIVKLPNTGPVLRLSTDRPLNEPFLHFLVELNWTSGRMVREYTFLLDPPEMLQATKPASVVAPASPVVTPLSKPAIVPEPKPAVAPADKGKAAVPAVPPVAPSQAQSREQSPAVRLAEREVKRGDTLSKIAREVKTDAVSLDQMLVALFNSNRDAFSGDNMNRLRAGKILRIPDVASAAEVEPGQARKLVIGQAADFNAYKRRLAEAAATAPAATAEPAQQVSGKITPKVEDKAPAAPVTDKLQVSRTEGSKTGAVADASRKSLEEDLIARDKALREASTRIAELEKNLDNLKKLAELKSQSGAQMQQQAQAAVTAAKPVESKPPAPPAKPAAEVAPAKPADAAPAVSAPPPAPAPAVAEKPVAPPPVAPAVAGKPVPPPPPPARKPLPPPPPPPEPDFLADNPEIVFGGGGVVALLLFYLGYARWRRGRQNASQQPIIDQPSVSESQVASRSGAVFGAASESVDNGEISIQGDFSESGVLTTEESVDPVAEADVLMAYGRDGQAEEILLEGLKTDPARASIHLKLLELYANRKSLAQFESVASQLHGLSGGQGPEWDKAVAMARGIGLTGGAFAVEATASESADQAVPPVAVSPAPMPAAASDTVIMPATEVLPEANPVEEDLGGSLDFDLDLGTTSGPALVAAQAQAQAKPASEEIASLDFDFDLGAPEPGVAPVSPPVSETAVPAASADADAIDFSLDIGSSDTAPMPAEPTPAAVPAATNDIDFDIDFGAPEPVAAEVEVPPAVASSTPDDEQDISFDLDIGADLAPLAAADSAAPADIADMPVPLDLSAISLDLDGTAEPSLPPVPDLPLSDIALPDVDLPMVEAGPGDSSDFDLSLDDIGESLPASDASSSADMGLPDLGMATSTEVPEALGDNPEVATKLELAQAYEEMGDLEGAKELLNEVLNEGSPAQQAIAQAKLGQLNV